jgi:hypothetical protein
VRYVAANGEELVVDWEPTAAGILIIGDPQPDIMDVQILASADFQRETNSIVVELRSKQELQQVATRLLTADKSSAVWSWPVPEGAERIYEYRVTLHSRLNEVQEGPWQETDDAVLVVGQGIFRFREVELFFLGSGLSALALLAIKLRLAHREDEAGLLAEDERLIEDSRQPIKWRYPVADPSQHAFDYQLTLIHQDGRMETRDPVTTDKKLVVIPLLSV